MHHTTIRHKWAHTRSSQCQEPHHTTVLRPFFRDHPGEPVPEENLRTLWHKGRSTEADTQTIWLGTTPSGLTSAHLHHPPIFTGQMPFPPPNQQCQSTEGNWQCQEMNRGCALTSTTTNKKLSCCKETMCHSISLSTTLAVQVEQLVRCVCFWTITFRLNDFQPRYLARRFTRTLCQVCFFKVRRWKSQVKAQGHRRKPNSANDGMMINRGWKANINWKL